MSSLNAGSAVTEYYTVLNQIPYNNPRTLHIQRHKIILAGINYIPVLVLYQGNA